MSGCLRKEKPSFRPRAHLLGGENSCPANLATPSSMVLSHPEMGLFSDPTIKQKTDTLICRWVDQWLLKITGREGREDSSVGKVFARQA